jgi:hypothetical protein
MHINDPPPRPVSPTPPKFDLGGFTCSVCDASVVAAEDGKLVAVRGTFSRCVSPASRAAAESGDISQRLLAVGSCPTFLQQIRKPYVPGWQTGGLYAAPSSGWLDWFIEPIDRWLERMGAPAALRTLIDLSIKSLAANPVLLFTLASGIYAAGAGIIFAVCGFGYAVGKAIIAFVPLAIHGLKDFADGSYLGKIVIGVVLLLGAMAWVRANRSYSYFLGGFETGMGVAIALSGFTTTENDVAALFALIGGAFTIIDGLQKMNDSAAKT